MIAILFSLISLCGSAQTTIRPLISEEELTRESFSRTVFIKGFKSKNQYIKFHATGTLLKDGLFITNKHVLESLFEGTKVVYQFQVLSKIPVTLESVSILSCDEKMDLCLLKIDKHEKYKLKYFSMEPPVYRKISKESPLGLFQDESIYFNGFNSGFANFHKAVFKKYTTTAFSGVKDSSDLVGVSSIEFSGPDNVSVAKQGDSGGPLFDSFLHLYGIVRTNVTFENKSRNIGVPVDQIRNFVSINKSKPISSTVPVIVEMKELEPFFNGADVESSTPAK